MGFIQYNAFKSAFDKDVKAIIKGRKWAAVEERV